MAMKNLLSVREDGIIEVLDDDLSGLQIGDEVIIYKDLEYSGFWNDAGKMDHWIGTRWIIREIVRNDIVRFIDEDYDYTSELHSCNTQFINSWTWRISRKMFKIIRKTKRKTFTLKFKT